MDLNLKPLLILLSFLAVSCTTSYYAPSPQHVPFIQQRGEINASANTSVYQRSISSDVQVAYSPLPHWSVMANTSFFDKVEDDSTHQKFGLDGHLVEGAVGYYKSLNEFLVFDVYAGYGYLFEASTTGFKNNFTSRFNYHRLFAQPSIGYKNEIVDFGLSCRISHLQYRNIRNDSIPPNNTFLRNALLINDQDFIMVEPALTFRVGYRYVKFQAQYGMAYNFSPTTFEYDRFAFTFGLVFNFRPNYMGPAPTKLP